MLLPPQNGGISMTFTADFCMESIFEILLVIAVGHLIRGVKNPCDAMAFPLKS